MRDACEFVHPAAVHADPGARGAAAEALRQRRIVQAHRPKREQAPRPPTSRERQQLGLKLESTRGPVDVLVVESIHEATEN